MGPISERRVYEVITQFLGRLKAKIGLYFVSFVVIRPIVVYLKMEFCAYLRKTEGVSSVANFFTTYEESQ